jgi:hypothetical protein
MHLLMGRLITLLNRSALGWLGWLSKFIRQKAKYPQDVHGSAGWPLEVQPTVLETAVVPAKVAPCKDQRAIGVPAVDEIMVIHVDNHSSFGVVLNGLHYSSDSVEKFHLSACFRLFRLFPNLGLVFLFIILNGPT